MHRHNVGRLLVTDRANRLIGIVTRRDLLRVHARLDAVITDEVAQRILRRTLMIEPGSVKVAVDDGVVTLTGRTGHKSTALAAVGLTEAVAGVTGVVDRLAFDTGGRTATIDARPTLMHGGIVIGTVVMSDRLAEVVTASGDDHDLGLFQAAAGAAPRRRGGIGLYRLAWQVDTIDDLQQARMTLVNTGAVTGEFSHGGRQDPLRRRPDGKRVRDHVDAATRGVGRV